MTCACVLAGVFLHAGCGPDSGPFTTEDRMERGLVVILPGIEGVSSLNRGIRTGLASAGCSRAITIYSWGRPVPGLGMLLNQLDVIGNRLAGVGIADMIVKYQDAHPGRPVHIVGHSGGGGVAVFAAEGMPEGRKVDGLVLLSASIWHGYDLTKALSRCKQGIVNFYNPKDAGILGVGTTVMGNVDGMRGPSAGLNGFHKTFPGLYQVRVMSMGDPHTTVVRPSYVASRVAPWMMSPTWPAGQFASGRAAPQPPAEQTPAESPASAPAPQPPAEQAPAETPASAPAPKANEAPASRPASSPPPHNALVLPDR